jgi:hypothetical protein
VQRFNLDEKTLEIGVPEATTDTIPFPPQVGPLLPKPPPPPAAALPSLCGR